MWFRRERTGFGATLMHNEVMDGNRVTVLDCMGKDTGWGIWSIGFRGSDHDLVNESIFDRNTLS